MSTRWLDSYARQHDYLRISITDRCDLRCVYCMAEDMTFVPRAQILSFEEIERIARIFVSNGVRKIRLTGGEPLIRPDIISLCKKLKAIAGLEELVITTNGTHLAKLAAPLYAAGVQRINISLDTLKPERFAQITRVGKLEKTLEGIEAARHVGFSRLKLNTVVMRGYNHDEVLEITQFALARGLDISFIEEMPLGDVGRDRGLGFFSSDEIQALLANNYTLIQSTASTGGPSRYLQTAEFPNSRIGFISPHSHNFCSTCNRLRLTAEGRLLLCLGNEHSLDLRALVRSTLDDQAISQHIARALINKPQQHQFTTDGEVQVVRFMNATGG
ncbi:GTP 3',8-cyclase MoaA [Pseudomonas sp. F1_0610]|uniref:GTP 3',8-cyclase MoaA n=1 Tax=Pseudomonas sp. F1_0610 TaxID=3114284 RepID=UPI0039C23AEA